MGRSILVVFLATILAISRLSINPTHGGVPPSLPVSHCSSLLQPSLLPSHRRCHTWATVVYTAVTLHTVQYSCQKQYLDYRPRERGASSVTLVASWPGHWHSVAPCGSQPLQSYRYCFHCPQCCWPVLLAGCMIDAMMLFGREQGRGGGGHWVNKGRAKPLSTWVSLIWGEVAVAVWRRWAFSE